ncbi:MAG: extracellular solute-binding protein, partial [Candidatus Caldatribacteriota bacterium]
MKLNKKLYLLMLIPFLFVATACNRNNQLLILNWGEYINDEVVVEFEKQTGYEVVISIADSNELFYSKIKSGTTAYDLVVPSDYMLEKMVQKDLVQKIDYSKLSNYDPINNPYMEGVLGIQSEMFEGNEDYGVPYFWGTFGLMYTLEKEGLQQAVLENSWKTLFEDNMR